MAASQPPPSVAHAPPRTTPWRAPAYKPAQPASGEHGCGLTAAALGSIRAASHHTAARASLQASTARVARARWRPHSRRPRQPVRRLAPHRGARRPTSQHSPRRASTRATSQPPSPAARAPHCATPRRPRRAPDHKPAQPALSEHGGGLAAAALGSTRAPPRATPWRAPAYKPAQPASSEHGGGLTAAALGSTRATPHHTVARASLQASVARVEQVRWQPHSRRPW